MESLKGPSGWLFESLLQTQFQNGQELTSEEKPHCGLELGGRLRSNPEKFVIWACE